MPHKRPIDESDKIRLSNLLKESYSSLLKVKSVFSAHYKQTDDIMIEISHAIHAHNSVAALLKRKNEG